MESIFMDLVSTEGIWVALSVALIFYIIKKQDKRDLRQEEREQNYQKIIQELTEKFSILSDLKDDISDIKTKLLR